VRPTDRVSHPIENGYKPTMKQKSDRQRESASDFVPTTPKNLYKIGGGWNITQSQTEQRIEGDFLPQKIEPTKAQLQDCLEELRQVEKSDNYWGIYERSPQLVSIAWKLLDSFEQLRIRLVCDEGIDPLEKWKVCDRVLLWHPFAQTKWGLALSGGDLYRRLFCAFRAGIR
jgi:hypothetical protein